MNGRDLPPHLASSSSSSSPQPRPSLPGLPGALGILGSSDNAGGSYGVGVNMSFIPDPEDDAVDEENIFRDMTFEEILEDLNARFLINLPKEETSLVRVYWQAEQAHWFYEDYLRPLNPLLPSLSQRQFSHIIIASSPVYAHLSSEDYDGIWEEYCSYKRMVPCCGGILINEQGDKCLVVRGWKSNAGWCFPRGKINSEESEVSCAIREVEEETGFSLAGRIRPDERIQTQINAQMVTMFIVGGIDENTVFETQTRKEIGAIEWVPFVDLPTWTNKKGPKTTTRKGQKKFYNVTPFVGPLKRWLTDHGFPVHPKRKAQNQKAGQRALEPFVFDGSPSASPQPGPSQPQSTQVSRDQTALDNLFHRFINKQTQELEAPGGASRENQAGLERLFGGMPSDLPTAGKDQEQHEDDALARLLGGLSTATPAPKAAQLDYDKGKASKLLAMLQTSPTSARKQAVEPHQASLLAVLSPPSQANVTQPGVSAVNTHTSLPTSPEPRLAEQNRAQKQKALLDQITAGLGLDAATGPDITSPPAPTHHVPAPYPTSTHAFTSPPHTSPAHSRQQMGHEQYHSRPPPPPAHDYHAHQYQAQSLPHSQQSEQQRLLLNTISSAQPPQYQHYQPAPPAMHMQGPPSTRPPVGPGQGYRPLHHLVPPPQSHGIFVPPPPHALAPHTALPPPGFRPPSQFHHPPAHLGPAPPTNPGFNPYLQQGLPHRPVNVATNYHHPVPRPPNSNAGALLGMLNDQTHR